MNDTQIKSTIFPVKRLSVIGAVIGGMFYFVIALGALYTFFGSNGWLVPRENKVSGYWIGRVMSSPINLFSLVAFGTAMGILFERRRNLIFQQSAFGLELLGDDEDALLLPEDALEYRKRLRHLDDEHSSLILIRLLSSGLQRARANWSAEDVGMAIKIQADIQQDETDADYSMVRYLAWAIPSIGFIGTVLGIGQAMGSLKPAGSVSTAANPETTAASATPLSDPLAEAAGHLHTAFDTTFVALVLSLILMYFLHRVQAEEDRFLAKATDWCLQRLPFRMHISKETQS